jgi:hypothetical protein
MDEEDWTIGYPISERYRDSFQKIAPSWRVTPLPAFDFDRNFIKVQELEVSLRGSLVLVYFELKHYAIRKRSSAVESNTISATVTQVTILERSAGRVASPYKSMMLKVPNSYRNHPQKKRIN